MAVHLAKELDESILESLIKKYRGKPGMLLSILEDLQNKSENKFLSENTLKRLAEKLKIASSQVYSVATFYTFFNLKPQGKHTIVVCRGTACHTRRSKNILEFLKKSLGLKEDEARVGEKIFLTTHDNKFTLRTVACFGQCALAPVVEVDGKIYGLMTEQKISKIINKLSKENKTK